MNQGKTTWTLIATIMIIIVVLITPLEVMAAGNSVSITLNYNNIDVAVGQGVTLTATVLPSDTGTITWGSADTSVATVNSSGYVLGRKTGTTTITAIYTGEDGTVATASCIVYVRLADGLYYIKNASSDLCMYTYGRATAITNQQTNSATREAQLWKISYVADGKYMINPITNTSLSLTVDASNYVVVDKVEAKACWGIVHNSFGYAIQYMGNDSENAKPVVASMPGSKIYLGSWESNLSCHWDLEPACGVFLRDNETQELIASTNEIAFGVGRMRSLEDLRIVQESYGNVTGGTTWLATDTSVARVSSNGTITGVSEGTTTITIKTALNGTYYSYSFFVNIESSVVVMSLEDEDENSTWEETSATIGENMADAVDVDNSSVQCVNRDNFANVWNQTTSDYVIIHTHGTANALFDQYAWLFRTEDFGQLERNTAIGYVLIIACSTGGDNGNRQNFASLLSKYIAEDGIVVCSTTIVSGYDTNFTAVDGEWIAYRNGQQIACDLPTVITVQDVADFWEG